MSNFAAMGKPMYMESYEEGERFQLAQEKLAEIIKDDITHSNDLFSDFMCEVYESKDFIEYSKLMREFVAHQDDYLDKAMEMREFLRSRIEKYSEKLAGQQLKELR